MIVVASSFEALCKNELMPDAVDVLDPLVDVCIFVSTCRAPAQDAKLSTTDPLELTL